MSNEQAKGCPWVISYCRAVLHSKLATKIGSTAALLLVTVANIMDEAWSEGEPVEIWNGQLMGTLGIANWKTLDNARRKAVESGWLEYHSNGDAAGSYKCITPQSYMHKSHTTLHMRMHTDTTTHSHAVVHTPVHNILPSPSPFPNPSLSPPEGAEAKELEAKDQQQPPKKEPRKPRPPPAAEDSELARFIWDAVRRMQPSRKPPNLDKWANDIRRMRETDKRTPDEIRQVFLWANADDFWQTNILSPEKLRSKFDDLTLRMEKARKGPQQAAATQQPQAMPIDPKNKYDV